MIAYLLIALAYVIGATPTSYWVGRAFFGLDLREHGSGNLGATNSFRVMGARAAIPVVVVDMAKGWFPAWFLPQINGESAWWWAIAYGSAAIVGHMFSFWVGFRGGKGVATSGGVFIALAPLATLIAFIGWVLAVWATRIVSVGSLVAAAVLPVAVFFTPHAGGTGMVYFTVALALFVIWAHRSNIGRLLRGEELGFRKAPDAAGSEEVS